MLTSLGEDSVHRDLGAEVRKICPGLSPAVSFVQSSALKVVCASPRQVRDIVGLHTICYSYVSDDPSLGPVAIAPSSLSLLMMKNAHWTVIRTSADPVLGLHIDVQHNSSVVS